MLKRNIFEKVNHFLCFVKDQMFLLENNFYKELPKEETRYFLDQSKLNIGEIVAGWMVLIEMGLFSNQMNLSSLI